MKLTTPSSNLLLKLAKDANNWNGTPLWDGTKEQCGNLCDLKKKGLVTTFKDEGCEWVEFTEKGIKVCKQQFHIDIDVE